MTQAGGSPTFATTRWSSVLAAGEPASRGSPEALECLCQTYWFPLYAHARRRGLDSERARDLTQGFFLELLSLGTVGRADPKRGRFRTFLLSAFDHYMHHARRHDQAIKRGGETSIISWDDQGAEAQLALEPLDSRSPDREYDRRWALATLQQASDRLRREFIVSGKVELFDLLRPCLSGSDQTAPYAEIAARLNLTVVSVKVTVYRLRHRYGEILREEVAQSLENPADADAELRHLIASLS